MKNNNTNHCSRPQGISDLDILWAIRDIPKSVLNSTRKGILSMLLAIIGNKGSCCYSQKELENKLGSSKRALQDQLNYLEISGFITIIRPFSYMGGDKNEYKLNYDFILRVTKGV